MPGKVTKRFEALRPRTVNAVRIASFGAVLTLSAGILSLISWIARSPALIAPDGVPMSADNGLFCALAGLGLLAAMRRQYVFTRLIGIIVAVTANLHFTADLAGFSVSIHTLRPDLAGKVLSPELAAQLQVAPATAVAFFLFGCALALIGPQRSNQVLAVKAAIGVVLAAIGGVTLFTDLRLALCGRAADAVNGVPLLAALCILVLGISLCMLCAIHSRSVSEELSPSSIVIAAIGLILIFGGTDTAALVKTRAALLSDPRVEVAYANIRATEKAVHFLRTAESSKQAYILTGHENELGSYRPAIAALRRELGTSNLRELAAWQEGNLDNLFAQRIAQFETGISLERTGHHREAIRLVESGIGSALTDHIEAEAAFVAGTLDAEVQARKMERLSLLKNLEDIVLASYLIAILLTAATVLLARYEARQHRKSSMKSVEPDLGPGEPAHKETGRLRTAADGTRPKNILLIEDSEDVQLLIQHTFNKQGGGRYRLTWAQCLKEGFRELTQGTVDLVLLDLGLPESSGLISYACVRGCAPQLPLLVMTGDHSPETKDCLVTAGVDGYLVKQQLSGTALLAAIESIFEKNGRPPQANLRRPHSGRAA